MVKAVMTSPAVTPRPLLSTRSFSLSSVAPLRNRSCRTSPPTPAVLLTLQCRMPPSTLSIGGAVVLLARSELGRPAIPSSELRISVICCSAAYGSTNGNGRPGSGIQESGDGYNSGFLSEDPKFAGNRKDGYSRQDFEAEKTAETAPKRRRRSFDSGREALSKRTASEKGGDDPYRITDDGQKVYLDELDVMTLLEPPPFLRPLQSIHYNHAAFLWKKIGDIPEERRHRLLDLLLPRHITKMWELAKLRYEDPELFVEHAADMLPRPDLPNPGRPMVWDGRVIQVPWYLTFFTRFQKVFFIAGDKKVYGRVITGGKFLRGLSDRIPLYFQVMHADSVMATEEPCDLVFEYGNGHLHLRDSIPPGFANPVKHLPPFNDKACDYLRAVGPGVMVGQSWVEGRNLEQFPRQLFGEFIIVQRFN